jgi:hypothetical protein
MFRDAASRGRVRELALRMINLTDVDLSAVRACFLTVRSLDLNFVYFPLEVWSQLLADCFAASTRQTTNTIHL